MDPAVNIAGMRSGGFGSLPHDAVIEHRIFFSFQSFNVSNR